MALSRAKALQGAKWSCPVVAVLLGVIALALFLIVPRLVAREVAREDHLGRDASGAYNLVLRKFQAPQYAMALQVWTFDVTNAARVAGYGAKPHVQEKGPYTFTETQRKSLIEFTANDTRILYRNNRTYVFDAARSCPTCSLNDTVTVPNLVFQKLADYSLKGYWYAVGLDDLLRMSGDHEAPFMRVSVGDFLFEGYVDPLIGTVCGRGGRWGHLLAALCAALGLPQRIGLLYGQNHTDDGLYDIDTGLLDAARLGRVYGWNGADRLDTTHWWATDARKLNGTDGQLFPPALVAGADLHIFVGQVCRSVTLSHSGYTEVEGIPAYVYSPSAAMNDVALQRRMGFCNPETPVFFNDTRVQEKACAPAGLLDMCTCAPGQPSRVYVSQSSFFGSPPQLREAVDGLREPVAADDATYVSIEPTSGVVVDAQRRSMLSLGVIPGHLQLYRHMRSTILPMVRLNETALVDDDTRQQLLRPIGIVHSANLAALALGVLAVLFMCAFAAIVLVESFRQRRTADAAHDLLVDGQHPLPQEGPDYGPVDGAVAREQAHT